MEIQNPFYFDKEIKILYTLNRGIQTPYSSASRPEWGSSLKGTQGRGNPGERETEDYIFSFFNVFISFVNDLFCSLGASSGQSPDPDSLLISIRNPNSSMLHTDIHYYLPN